MKKKIIWGSVVVALLMLVNTQTVFMNTVRSDPTQHTGDADVGDLWISELNVAAAALDFTVLGIGRANATDDWVLWVDGRGNINASWSVEIGNNHPEFLVQFALSVYLANDSIALLGNDTLGKTYSENTAYDESGTLTVVLEFTPEQMAEYSQTLVCFLGISVQLNNTQDAVNFSSIAHDRCVVAVDFLSPIDVPKFSDYVDEANDNCPGMWSWLDGWDEADRFDDEDDMLNNQTYFSVGKQSPTQGNPEGWDLGHVYINIISWARVSEIEWPVFYPSIERIYPMTPDQNHWMEDNTYIDYESHKGYQGGLWPKIWYKYRLFCEGVRDRGESDIARVPPDSTGDTGMVLGVDDRWDTEWPYGYINVWGWVWINIGPLHYPRPLAGFWIKIDNGVSKSVEEEVPNIYWEQSCAYQNESYYVEVDSSSAFGITAVEANIIEALTSESTDEFVYTYAGDRGDTRIELICE